MKDKYTIRTRKLVKAMDRLNENNQHNQNMYRFNNFIAKLNVYIDTILF